jgi:hypothetical protein
VVWFNVDDGLAFHRKTLRAGNAAMGLWVRAGAECAGQLTDGFVSTLLARQLGTAGEAGRLVDADLWHRAEHVDKCPECVEHGMLDVVARAAEPGFVFHEWWLRNRSRDQVERERAEARERMKKARTKNAGSRDVRPNTQRTNGGTSAEVRVRFGDPFLALPNQTPLLTLVGRLAVSDARGTAPPPAEQIALWQDLAGPGVDLEQEARRYLERNLGRPARDEAAAWVGWLRAGAARRPQPDRDPTATCGDPSCYGGWLPDDPDGRPVPCPTCRPHLQPVRTESA